VDFNRSNEPEAAVALHNCRTAAYGSPSTALVMIAAIASANLA
jgi:hypothetical protein